MSDQMSLFGSNNIKSKLAKTNKKPKIKTPERDTTIKEIPEETKKAVHLNIKVEKPVKREIIVSDRIVLIVIKVILAVAGIICAIMSGRYSFYFYKKTLQVVYAVMASSAMTSVSIISFEVIILAWKYRYKVVSGVFAVMWVILTLSSMNFTVDGQYTYLRDKAIETASIRGEEERLRWRYNELKSAYIVKTDEKTLLIGQIADFNKVLMEMSNNGKTTDEYMTETWRITSEKKKSEKNLELLEKTILIEKLKVDKFIEENPSINFQADYQEFDAPDYYSFVSGVIKGRIRPNVLQFTTNAAPAVFYDIIAPVALSVVLFLNGKKPEKKKRSRKVKKWVKTISLPGDDNGDEVVNMFKFKSIIKPFESKKKALLRVEDGTLYIHAVRVFGFLVRCWVEIGE